MNEPLNEAESKKPKRHGCLVAYIAAMIFFSSWAGIVYLFGRDFLQESYPESPVVAFSILTVLSIANIGFCVALIKWKKFGFYGFVGISIVAAIVNGVIGLSIGQILLGLSGPVILYVVLQLGDDDRAWDHLE